MGCLSCVRLRQRCQDRRTAEASPVYLGWRLVDGRLVHTATHPAIIEEDTFLLTQQILTEHGRRPTQGVVRSARP